MHSGSALRVSTCRDVGARRSRRIGLQLRLGVQRRAWRSCEGLARARCERTATSQRELFRRAIEASQSRLCKGRSVGRRSTVSSSSALWASSCRASPRARAMRSATSQVGLAMPRSRPRIDVGSRSAVSARASWVRPISSRRRRIARPRATWGLWLIRTPETLGGRAFPDQGTSSR